MNANAKTIATYAAAGMNDKEIAAKMGLSKSGVAWIRRENGIQSAIFAEAEGKRREVAHLHGCGLSDREIALTMGDSHHTVRLVRRNLGLPVNKPFLPKGMPPRERRERQRQASLESKRRKAAEKGKEPRKEVAPKPKPKPVAVAPAPKPALHEQIRPIRAAIGGVFEREPSADVQAAVAVAMSRLHTDRAFARAWMECGT